MAFRLLAVLALLGAVRAASDESIDDLMASLKGMPGMDGIKMFTVRCILAASRVQLAYQLAYHAPHLPVPVRAGR